MKETEIQKAILDYLGYQRDIYFFRAGSGAVATRDGGFFRSGKVGCPDIVVCKNGKFVGLEVKNENGKLSQNQVDAGLDITNAGGIYRVVRSIDDVAEVLKGI